jgi:branched-chain amino acid transport system substrate-binding protein
VKAGGATWFFITADYAFGASLERDTASVVKAEGGQVLGEVKHPLSTQDFSSYLLAAQSSGAKVIGLANTGGDSINAIKQASEFGIVKRCWGREGRFESHREDERHVSRRSAIWQEHCAR